MDARGETVVDQERTRLAGESNVSCKGPMVLFANSVVPWLPEAGGDRVHLDARDVQPVQAGAPFEGLAPWRCG
jgi:hypothetical protein